MKNIVIGLLCLICLAGCTKRTQFGDCVGLMDTEDAKLNYDYSKWNIFVGILFSETLVVPVLIIAKGYECPMGVK
jgi:hypothetical protein